jgi:pre-mRNA-splicing factor CWC22
VLQFAGRAGGAYIPPFRLARMMAEIDDKNSAAAQKLSWEALRKSLNGLINKVRCRRVWRIALALVLFCKCTGDACDCCARA